MSRLFNEIVIAAEQGKHDYKIGRNKIKVFESRDDDFDLDFEFSGTPNGNQNCSVWKTGSETCLLYTCQKTKHDYHELIFPSISRSKLWQSRLKEIVHKAILHIVLDD